MSVRILIGDCLEILRQLERLPRQRGETPRHEQYDTGHQTLDDYPRGLARHIRNVWSIATKPFPEAHFATFPPELVEPCIKAAARVRATTRHRLRALWSGVCHLL